MKALGHLGDAVITMGMLIALALGVDVKTIVVIWLFCQFFGELCKAFSAFVDPILETMKQIGGRR